MSSDFELWQTDSSGLTAVSALLRCQDTVQGGADRLASLRVIMRGPLLWTQPKRFKFILFFQLYGHRPNALALDSRQGSH